MKPQFFIIVGIIAIMCALIIYTIWHLNAKKVIYDINVVIYNSQNEFIIVYDKSACRLCIPHANLKINENPSKVVFDLLMSSCKLGHSDFIFSPLFHASMNKFDRTRDNVGPALIIDYPLKFTKKCILVYVVQIKDSFENLPRDIYPYPEFFSMEEINKMDDSTRPSKQFLDIIRSIYYEITMNVNEGKNCKYVE